MVASCFKDLHERGRVSDNSLSRIAITAIHAVALGLTAVLIILAVGCSNNLTRGEAEASIKARLKFPINETRTFNLWTDGFCGGFHHDPCLPEHIGDTSLQRYPTLQREGLLTVAFEGNSSRSSLTEKGKQYAVGPPTDGTDPTLGFRTQDIEIIRSSLEFGEITGMVEVEGSKSVQVDFTLSRKFTPFGRILDQHQPATIAKSVRSQDTMMVGELLNKPTGQRGQPPADIERLLTALQPVSRPMPVLQPWAAGAILSRYG